MKQYLDLVREVLARGEHRSDRTGVGTISLFGAQTRYDLREGEGFPLCTTKRVNFKAVVLELLWFLRGETNTGTLGCGIWDEWAREDGDLGPIYGCQWRHWGGDNKTQTTLLRRMSEMDQKDWDEFKQLMIERLSGVENAHELKMIPLRPGSIDQIAVLADLLLKDPYSRRLIVSAWNVADLPAMALSPCHAMFQLYCTPDGFIDLQLYQRSADLALGVPFNIASYALLLMMFAKVSGRTPRYFVHTLGDVHIYQNHVAGLLEQVSREPGPLPRVTITKVPDFSSPEAFNITPDDIVLEGYKPAPSIRFPIAV